MHCSSVTESGDGGSDNVKATSTKTGNSTTGKVGHSDDSTSTGFETNWDGSWPNLQGMVLFFYYFILLLLLLMVFSIRQDYICKAPTDKQPNHLFKCVIFCDSRKPHPETVITFYDDFITVLGQVNVNFLGVVIDRGNVLLFFVSFT